MSFMSTLFGGAKAPAPMPVPVSPQVDAAAQAARENAARAAMADQLAGGRRSTMVGGMQIAYDEQQKRAASKVLG